MFPLFDSQAAFRKYPSGDVSIPLDVQQRLPQFVGLSEAADQTLAAQSVAVVGTGGVGRPLAIHLARLGVKQIALIDPGHYDDPANLVTQPILPADLQQSKVESTADVCRRISPQTEVLTYQGRLQDLDPIWSADADFAFLATDNLSVEVAASERFRLLGIPLMQASVHGETFVAQVRLVANQQDAAACLICAYGPEEVRHLNESTQFRCGGPGTTATQEETTVAPTRSTSFLCSLAADLGLTQWIRHTLSLGKPVSETLLQYCGFTHRMTISPLIRNAKCTADHQRLRRIRLLKPLAECTCSQLAAFAGCESADWKNHSLTLGNLNFVESTCCRCGRHAHRAFMQVDAVAAPCAACGESSTPEPFHTFRPAPLACLQSVRNRPLRLLGGGDATWAVIHGPTRAALLLDQTNV